MRTTGVSTSSILHCMERYNKKLDGDVIQLRKEAVTGQHADFGIKFGSKVSHILELDQENQHIKEMRNSNALAKSRLSVSQASLEYIDKVYQKILNNTIIIREGGDQNNINYFDEIKESLKCMADISNTILSGDYLFAGTNTSERPFQDYFAKDSPAKKSFDQMLDNFLKENLQGKQQDISSMTAHQMTEFIDKLEKSFLDNDYWAQNWSKASDQNIKYNLNSVDIMDTSVNANMDGMRRLAISSVIGIEFMSKNLSPESRKVVNEKIINNISKGLDDIKHKNSLLGMYEKRIDENNLFIQNKESIIEFYIAKKVGIDNYKTSITLEELVSKIDMSYMITSKINKLSFLKFL